MIGFDISGSIPGDWISLGDVCRNRLGMQCQYGSRYANDICKDLRIIGTTADYHSMQIHREDVDEYVGRVLRFRYDNGIISKGEFENLIPSEWARKDSDRRNPDFIPPKDRA